MNHRRTTNRATWLFTLAALITLHPLLFHSLPLGQAGRLAMPLPAAASPAAAGGAWTNQLPTPCPRHAPVMASIGEDRALLFGGVGSGYFSQETWLATGFFIPFRVYYLPLVAE